MQGQPTRLLVVVGPFWPCLVFVTFPMIICVSIFSAAGFIPICPPWVVALWAICTTVLMLSLCLTGCTDPGIVRRVVSDAPEGWIWSDQAQSFRPPRSRYDSDCGVVIEEFDHTCPWTGTGIGRRNMPFFSTFVSFVCICIIINMLVVVGVFTSAADSASPQQQGPQ